MGDPPALCTARLTRLRAAMESAGQDALLVTSAAAVRYATGAVPIHGESSVEAARPFAAVVGVRGVHVLGVEPRFVPADVGVHALPRAAEARSALLADLLAGARRVGMDRLPAAIGAALQRRLPGVAFTPAEASLLPARRVKTADELALLREAQALNEAAIADVLPAIVPGVCEVELSGRFLAAMADRGVTACHVEPIWCVIPRTAAEAPWTFAGGLPYRELTSARVLTARDQVMIDTGILHGGYMSDFGCTRVCGEPDSSDRALRARWRAIADAVLAECRPGRTAAALHRAALEANGTDRPAPWPVPLYLAHGLGLGGVEPPFIGTDLGLAAEERMVLEPGMVLVLEPYVWEEGRGGYRAEETVAITEAGYERLSAPPP